MKKLARNFIISFVALAATAEILPAFSYQGGIRTLLIGSLVFMLIHVLVIPLLKVMFLPLNLLTLGFFSWVVNVVGLYIMTLIFPHFKILPYSFPGATINGFSVPPAQLTVLYVAILASFLIGFISHLLKWLIHD